jgi:putative flippase GtrA
MKKEVARFLVSGTSAVLTDLGSYYFLIGYFPHHQAKGVSFLLGTIVAFLLNKFWTFNKPDYSSFEIAKFVSLYSSTLLINVGMNSFVLHLLPEQLFLGFLTATGTSTVLNFIGQKWWVFSKK